MIAGKSRKEDLGRVNNDRLEKKKSQVNITFQEGEKSQLYSMLLRENVR